MRVPCKYCGTMMQDTIMALHLPNCPAAIKAGAPEAVSGAARVPPPVAFMAPPPIVPPIMVTTIEADGDLVQTTTVPAPLSPDIAGLFRPTKNPYFVMPMDMQDKLKRILQGSRSKPRNLLLTGPQGAGKTSIGRQLAAVEGRWCYIAPCVTMQEPSQWFGQQAVSPERGTFYIESAFVTAIETPYCVVILDDLNRTENSKVLNPLFPLLEPDQREVYLDDLARSVKVAEGVIFVGTVNEGYQFQGTDPIDLALRDRFDQIVVEYPPAAMIEQIILQRTGIDSRTSEIIGRFASTLKDHPNPEERIYLSMRSVISIAEDIALGASIRDAVTFSIAAGFQDDQIEKVNAILQTILQDNYTSRVPDWRSWN